MGDRRVDPGEIAFCDAVDGDGDDDLTGPGVLGPYSVLGTPYVPAPDAEALSDTLGNPGRVDGIATGAGDSLRGHAESDLAEMRSFAP